MLNKLWNFLFPVKKDPLCPYCGENCKSIYSELAGIKSWYLNGKLHHENGPAYIHSLYKGHSGIIYYYLNGKLHRTDGPARLIDGTTKDWWINGNNITRDVNQWMKNLDVNYPFDEDTKAQFLLTFCG